MSHYGKVITDPCFKRTIESNERKKENGEMIAKGKEFRFRFLFVSFCLYFCFS